MIRANSEQVERTAYYRRLDLRRLRREMAGCSRALSRAYNCHDSRRVVAIWDHQDAIIAAAAYRGLTKGDLI